jgi:hypothetical protein
MASTRLISGESTFPLADRGKLSQVLVSRVTGHVPFRADFTPQHHCGHGWTGFLGMADRQTLMTAAKTLRVLLGIPRNRLRGPSIWALEIGPHARDIAGLLVSFSLQFRRRPKAVGNDLVETVSFETKVRDLSFHGVLRLLQLQSLFGRQRCH